MIRVLIQLWPALLPTLLFLLWHFAVKKPKAKRLGDAHPLLKEGPWFVIILATIALAVVLLFIFGLSKDHVKGEYIPARIEGDAIQHGEINR